VLVVSDPDESAEPRRERRDIVWPTAVRTGAIIASLSRSRILFGAVNTRTPPAPTRVSRMDT